LNEIEFCRLFLFQLSKLAKQRGMLRRRRKEDLHIPTVAVVGYTNCGKTSLIKALTGKEELTPRNQLFATLDVTVHEGRLPSNMKTLFIDTVGFISDIPTNLIASFSATLEDAAQADLLIHVRDVSNPNHPEQNENVIRTLKSLGVSSELMDNMITLGNKIDLVDPSQWKRFKNEEGLIPISATEGEHTFLAF
jgi:GTP-binding protein HflX